MKFNTSLALGLLVVPFLTVNANQQFILDSHDHLAQPSVDTVPEGAFASVKSSIVKAIYGGHSLGEEGDEEATGHGVLDFSEYTILEIIQLNAREDEPIENEKVGERPGWRLPSWPKKPTPPTVDHLPIRKLAWLVSKSEAAQEDLAAAEGITLLAPTDWALRRRSHGPGRGGRGGHDKEGEHDEFESAIVHPFRSRTLTEAMMSDEEHPRFAKIIAYLLRCEPHSLLFVFTGLSILSIPGGLTILIPRNQTTPSPLLRLSTNSPATRPSLRRSTRVAKALSPSESESNPLGTSVLSPTLDSSSTSTRANEASLSKPRMVSPFLQKIPPAVVFTGTCSVLISTPLLFTGVIHFLSAPLLPPLSPLNTAFLFPTFFSTLTSGLQRVGLDQVVAPHAEVELSEDESLDASSSLIDQLVQELATEAGVRQFTFMAPTNFAFNRLGFVLLSFSFPLPPTIQTNPGCLFPADPRSSLSFTLPFPSPAAYSNMSSPTTSFPT